jgi:hypothetical protein
MVATFLLKLLQANTARWEQGQLDAINEMLYQATKEASI